MSAVWWKSERKVSSSGAVGLQLRPLGSGCRRMTPWLEPSRVYREQPASSFAEHVVFTLMGFALAPQIDLTLLIIGFAVLTVLLVIVVVLLVAFEPAVELWAAHRFSRSLPEPTGRNFFAFIVAVMCLGFLAAHYLLPAAR